MKRLIWIVFFFALSWNNLFPFYELLNSLDKSSSFAEINSVPRKRSKIQVCDINFNPLAGVRVVTDRGEKFITDSNGEVELSSSNFSKIKLEKEGFISTDFITSEIEASKGICILLEDKSQTSLLKIKKSSKRDIEKVSAISYGGGSGGIELPDTHSLGEGKSGMATSFAIDDSRVADNQYHVESSFVYGLTDKMDIGVTYQSFNGTDSYDENSDIQGFFKYHLSSYELEGKKIHLAVGAKSENIDNTNIFMVVGMEGDKGSLNLVAEKNRETGANNYGFLWQKQIRGILPLEKVEKNYVMLEMKQNSDDRLSLINAGYRMKLKNNWNLDLFFKRNRADGTRTTGLGGSIVF